jgi:hypothetical protein
MAERKQVKMSIVVPDDHDDYEYIGREREREREREMRVDCEFATEMIVLFIMRKINTILNHYSTSYFYRITSIIFVWRFFASSCPLPSTCACRLLSSSAARK